MVSTSNHLIIQPCPLERYAYQLDPYIGCEHGCAYCYTLNLSGSFSLPVVQMLPGFADRLRNELSTIAPQTIYMGMNTDPYQPAEETYKQARQALNLFVELGFSVCILTKSDLILRDIDLLQKMERASVGLSLAFQDEEIWIKFEPYAPSNNRWIDALKKLKEAGIETYVLICPVMPYITDVDMLIDAVATITDTIWIYPLRMKSTRDRSWQNVLSLLRRDFPALPEIYQQVIFKRDHPFWVNLSDKLEELRSEWELNLKIELLNQGSGN